MSQINETLRINTVNSRTVIHRHSPTNPEEGHQIILTQDEAEAVELELAVERMARTYRLPEIDKTRKGKE